jgi:hypothetical protein
MAGYRSPSTGWAVALSQIGKSGKDKTMNEQEYNGWSNRETWATNLWLTNDYGMTKDLEIYFQELHNEGEPTTPEILRNFVEYVETYVNELLEFENLNPTTYSMLTDIGSLYRVNWREIAQGFSEELA